MGPTGAGKTTTLRLILGLDLPDSGHASVGGRAAADRQDATAVGALLNPNDVPSRRVAHDHLLKRARALGLPRVRADESLDLVGLRPAADRRLGTFSIGMKFRLGLAAALLGNPGVLILDEPFGSLDPEGVKWLREFLRAFANQGRTVLFSSHRLADVVDATDRVVIIAAGRLVADHVTNEVAAAFRSGDPETAFLRLTRSRSNEAPRR